MSDNKAGIVKRALSHLPEPDGFIFDEQWLAIDARVSMSKRNAETAYAFLILQNAGKKIHLRCQTYHGIDRRIRLNAKRAAHLNVRTVTPKRKDGEFDRRFKPQTVYALDIIDVENPEDSVSDMTIPKSLAQMLFGTLDRSVVLEL